jgi:hypothetical protein
VHEKPLHADRVILVRKSSKRKILETGEREKGFHAKDFYFFSLLYFRNQVEFIRGYLRRVTSGGISKEQ